MSRRCREVDRLSSFPEDVLSVILSLMPTNSAVRTSILSKSWRYTWTLTHNLEFDDTRLNSYSHVDQVLILCKTTRLETFRLHFSKIYVRNSMTVSKWISEAVRLNVSELDIQMISHIGLPLSLFTCNTLSKLSLKVIRPFYNEFSWECPPSTYLPNLKTLDIANNYIRSDFNLNSIFCDNIFKLIHGCPLLEDLSLEIHINGNTEDFYFKVPTLRRLKLALLYWSDDSHTVVLNVPNLEYLHIEENIEMRSLFVMEDLSSLVKAKVSCYICYDHLWAELLKGLSQVRNLILDTTKLVLVGRDRFNLQRIPQILKIFCQLEHLCIKKEYVGSCRQPTSSFPVLTCKNIVTVKYTDTAQQGEFDTQFLRLILENAVDLEKLIVRYNSVLLSDERKERLYAELSNYPRASRNCQIQLAPYNSSPYEPDNN